MTDDRTAVDESSRSTATETDSPFGRAFRCTDCDNRWYYDRIRCPECNCDTYDTYELGTGTLLATTTARVTPPRVRDENDLGLVEFDSGVTVIAQIDGARSSLDVGDEVEFAGDFALNEGVTGPRLRPTVRTDRQIESGGKQP